MSNFNSPRIIRTAICCGIAGFLGFLIQEPGTRASELATASKAATTALTESALMFGLLGLLIGAGLVIAEELGSTTGKRITSRLVIGAGAGGLCGAGAGLIGQTVYSSILSNSGTNIASLIFARTLGWAAVGAGTGLSSGLASGSNRKAMQGALGGAIGGAVGGVLFDIASIPFGGGTASRMIGDTAIGAFVGAFVVAVEEIAKAAWVTVVAGRNEGKQYILSKSSTSIGRDELSDIPLYGDISVSKNHAVVQTMDGQHFIFSDLGSQQGSIINGQRIGQKPLSDQDTIQIGHFHLVFNHKTTAFVASMPPVGYGAVPVPQMQNSQICQFCGGTRDAISGQCLCIPVSGSPSVKSRIAILYGMSGPYQSITFPLDGMRVEIGRDESNGLVLESDAGVSRNHAVIACENGIHFVQDNNSSNGTYVNGGRIQRAVLNSGDLIHMGNSDFRFTIQ